MKRVKYLDAARGIAIIAVVIDHAFFLFQDFRNEIVWKHVYFSIPWFIFLAGYTSALSIQKYGFKFPASAVGYWLRRWSILIWYTGISFFIYWFDTKSNFNVLVFFDKLLHFSIEPVYYFINLILQLYFVFPFLFLLFQFVKNRYIRILALLGLYGISAYLMTVPAPWPFSPAGRIFGGLYLFVFGIGIVFALEKFINHKIVLLASMIVFGVLENYFLLTNGVFIGIAPNFYSIFWSVSLLIIALGFLFIIKETIVSVALAFIGKSSLQIYLIHYFLLRAILPWPKNTFEFIANIAAAILLVAVIQLLFSKLYTRIHLT